MTERARREYAAALRPRYQIADKRDRGRILDQYCRTTGCHRKAPIPVSRGASSPRPDRVLESAAAEPNWLAPSQPPLTRLQ